MTTSREFDFATDSDPLRYSMFDRAAKPIAARLAGLLKIPYPHAKGALSEFWDACGEPRELEAMLERGEREVVLTAKVARLRFKIASEGHDVDPESLVELRVLAKTGDDSYRVRGMWRYFNPIEARIEARKKAAAGGKASAEVRRKRYGTAQPRSALGSASGSGAASAPASGSASAVVRDGFEPPPNPARSTAEVADSGQRGSSEKKHVAQARPPGPADRIFEHWRTRTKKPRAKLDKKRERLIDLRLAEGHSEQDLMQSIDGYAKSPFHNGDNDRKQKFLGLELILRDTAHVEAGLELLNPTNGVPRTRPL